MTLEDVRAALMSDAGNVLVEAPAGCGKTHEAAKLACELAARLPDGREVLLLAHTNAAVQEFRLRTGGAGGTVRATTIDAFCLDLRSAYRRPCVGTWDKGRGELRSPSWHRRPMNCFAVVHR